jgi:tRNA-2-methylthio-N6-dimethylallyladenosine synthase
LVAIKQGRNKVKRFFFETYGCQMNKAESAALERALTARSWEAAKDADGADLVVINTCSVRITAENRAWGRIAHYAAKKRDRAFYLVVTGCMAERLKRRLKEEQPAVDCVLALSQRSAFALLIDAMEAGKAIEELEESPVFSFSKNHWETGAFRSFVPITHGCDNFCSYCIVPYLRGREISRPVDEIIGEMRELESRGVREVTLLGQNVNSYRWRSGDKEIDFPGCSRQSPPNSRAAGTSVGSGL